MVINHTDYLILTTLLFIVGISGICLNRKNILVILMSIELLLLAININFILFSIVIDDLFGQLFSFFILTIAACESSIGLALLVVYYRIRGSIKIELISLIKG